MVLIRPNVEYSSSKSGAPLPSVYFGQLLNQVLISLSARVFIIL
ncbi:hypothetical protein HNR39_004413 [Glaciimonas immobilis]|uniref:Uncharacterized protein n=1 Tax=Glaciimonas immobilis TaxID=728004 RepID=A0A840S0D6_9BURK|nr:hypothetical protein [Glaciimonas immobilis]